MQMAGSCWTGISMNLKECGINMGSGFWRAVVEEDGRHMAAVPGSKTRHSVHGAETNRREKRNGRLQAEADTKRGGGKRLLAQQERAST